MDYDLVHFDSGVSVDAARTIPMIRAAQEQRNGDVAWKSEYLSSETSIDGKTDLSHRYHYTLSRWPEIDSFTVVSASMDEDKSQYAPRWKGEQKRTGRLVTVHREMDRCLQVVWS